MIKKLLFLLLFSLTTIAQTNLVPNGDFEIWTSSSQPDKWFGYFSGVLSQSSIAQSGSSSTNMKIASGTFNFINTGYFPVTINKTYRVTVYHKVALGTFSSIDLSIYHKPGTFKSEIIKKTDAAFSNTEWRKIEFEYTATVTENIEVDLWATGTLNSEILVDNVAVIDVADVPVQYTLIPDVNFEKKLIALGIDSGVTDGKVLTNSINKLTDLNVSSSSITDLTGIQDFVALKTFNCTENLLINLDVSENVALTNLDCASNQLTTLDVSKNVALTSLDCNSNKLLNLNLKNGKNTLLDNLDFKTNPNLTCILVDDASYSNTKWTTKKDDTATYNDTICARYTLIPDVKFENKLIALGIDSGVSDGKVLTSSIASITDLNLYYSSITDLTGIQDFVSLTTLNCSLNQLTSINLHENIALNYLDLSYNKLASIDVSSNLALQTLYFHYNELTGIDFTKNTVLKYLVCKSNQLTSLNISNNIALSYLDCSSNQLTDLDLSKNAALTLLICSNNKLLSLNLKNGNNKYITNTSIDLTKNPLLTCIQVDNAIFSNATWAGRKDVTAGYSALDCSLVTLVPDTKFEDKLIALEIDTDGKNGVVLNSSIRMLTSLDVSNSSIVDLTGIQGFSGLNILNCSSNQLTNLDVSKNVTLTSLNCSNNNLLSLDLKNGNNTLFNNSAIDFSRNSTLTCIQVDDADYSTSKWGLAKDATANYNTDCTPYTLIPDTNFEDKLIALKIDTDGKNGKISTSSINTLNYLDLSSSNITDITGISDFTALTYLDCNYNNLKTIDVSNNKSLIKLSLFENNLSSLDVTNNTKLLNLECGKNKIISIDVSQNTKLFHLGVDRNQLTNLNVSKNVDLQSFYCHNNNLTSLDLKNQTKLLLVDCGFNEITTLDLSTNTVLEGLYCYNMELKTLDLSQNKFLKTLNCSTNLLTSLDISQNTKLELLFIEFNPITSLNLQNGNNKNFIVPSKTNKTTKTLGIVFSSFTNNPKLSCIQVDDAIYSNANWSGIKDSTAKYASTCSSLSTTDVVFENLSVYPNPTKDLLHLDDIVLEKVTIYDTLGHLVKTKTFMATSNQNTVDLSGLAKGIYYAYLFSDGVTSVRKIIVN